MEKQTYYITKFKTIFLKNDESECHGGFAYHGQVEFSGTLDELRAYALKRSRVNSDYEGRIVLTVYYFEYENGLEDYSFEKVAQLQGDEDADVSEPSEKTWLI